MKLPGGSIIMFDEHRYLYLTSAWFESDTSGNQPNWGAARIKEKYFKTAAGKTWLKKNLF